MVPAAERQNTTHLQVMLDVGAEGNPQAYAELINLASDRLLRLTRKMLRRYPHLKRWEQTDDIFQQAAMRLWKALEKVQPENSRHYFNLAALQVRRELIDVARKLSGPLGIAGNLDSISGEQKERRTPDGPGNDSQDPVRLAAWTEFHEAVDQLDDTLRETFQW